MQQHQLPDDDEALTYYRIGLDDESTELLLEIAVLERREPRLTLKKLIQDMLFGHKAGVEVYGPINPH